MEIAPSIKSKLSHLTSRPGVYLMKDRLGRVIYVGKAKALNQRVRSYFQPGRFSQMDPKTRALVGMVMDLETFEVENETEAIILESKLIKQYRPKYNIAFRDDKQFLLVKLTREPFPRFVLTRLQKRDGCRYFGPFIHSVALRNTLRYLHRNFHIRSCRPAQPGEQDYTHCLEDILQHCSAPCVGRVTREEYLRWVERACLFLEGRDEDTLKEMEGEMIKAAERKDFERAVVLRDSLHDLRQTVKQSSRKFVRDMPRSHEPELELASLGEALGLKQRLAVIEGFDISHIHGQHAVGSMVQFVNGRPMKANYRHYVIQGPSELEKDLPRTNKEKGPLPLGGNDDFASIREIVGRRYRRLKKEEKPLPDLILIDGGRGQLNSALLALREEKLVLPIVGLAKDEEEIYIPDRPIPLKLSDSSPALKLLQRVRDESHRFANSLHENWRRKRIRESLLDEFPGIGDRRKKALLQKFGSLERLRQATVEQIGETEGFGKKSAEALWLFLRQG